MIRATFIAASLVALTLTGCQDGRRSAGIEITTAFYDAIKRQDFKATRVLMDPMGLPVASVESYGPLLQRLHRRFGKLQQTRILEAGYETTTARGDFVRLLVETTYERAEWQELVALFTPAGGGAMKIVAYQPNYWENSARMQTLAREL